MVVVELAVAFRSSCHSADSREALMRKAAYGWLVFGRDFKMKELDLSRSIYKYVRKQRVAKTRKTNKCPEGGRAVPKPR